jgi:lipopolysaccharide/colanic/teichoic acid biosynthesis glycosyltransferase
MKKAPASLLTESPQKPSVTVTVTRGQLTADASGCRRHDLIEELYGRYSRSGSNNNLSRLRVLSKRILWILVVDGTRFAKRLVDAAAALAGLLCLSPLFAAVALAIKLTDRGPVLFWQTRVGQWGREFPFPKFRSMVVNAEKLKDQLQSKNDHTTGVTFKMKKDPRITWIGRIIRKLSIDELPQLWCVLNGEMSLVGPRPPLPREVAAYTLSDRRRLDAKPGLTCIWQVSGRSDIPFDRQVLLDVEYIESQSFWFDIQLLLKTIPAVLLGRGAY